MAHFKHSTKKLKQHSSLKQQNPNKLHDQNFDKIQHKFDMSLKL